MIKRRVLFCILAVLGLGMAATAAPRIQVDTPVHTFGEAVEGTIVTHKFILRSVGDEPLVIEKVTVDCRECTTTSLSQSELDPGGWAELEVRVDTTGFDGPIQKTITVQSNDVTTRWFVIRIIGVVKAEGSTDQPFVSLISAADLYRQLFLLIDLRDSIEYSNGHLLGAINIPFEELPGWVTRLPRGVPVIVYDKDGSRSDEAVKILQDAAFLEVKSLQGGFRQWISQYDSQYLLSLK